MGNMLNVTLFSCLTKVTHIKVVTVFSTYIRTHERRL